MDEFIINKTSDGDDVPAHIRQQRIWREKQLMIFYRTGRPIFNTFIEKKHSYTTLANGVVVGGIFK